MTYQLTIEYGDDVLLNMGMRKEEFDQEARFLLAAKLYEPGRRNDGRLAMWKDPIVEEVHRIRKKLSAKFDHDIDAICADARARERKAGQKVVDLSSKKVRGPLNRARSGR